MNGTKRTAFLSFVAVGGVLGLGLFAVVASLTAATDGLFAFVGGFSGALLLGAAIPRARRSVMAAFAALSGEFRPRPPAEVQATVPRPKPFAGDRFRAAPHRPSSKRSYKVIVLRRGSQRITRYRRD